MHRRLLLPSARTISAARSCRRAAACCPAAQTTTHIHRAVASKASVVPAAIGVADGVEADTARKLCVLAVTCTGDNAVMAAVPSFTGSFYPGDCRCSIRVAGINNWWITAPHASQNNYHPRPVTKCPILSQHVEICLIAYSLCSCESQKCWCGTSSVIWFFLYESLSVSSSSMVFAVSTWHMLFCNS